MEIKVIHVCVIGRGSRGLHVNFLAPLPPIKSAPTRPSFHTSTEPTTFRSFCSLRQHQPSALRIALLPLPKPSNRSPQLLFLLAMATTTTTTAAMRRPQPHTVVIPYPCSSSINQAFQLAKLLHQQGVYVTFVNTEHKHRRMLDAESADALTVGGGGMIRFETIPHGLTDAPGRTTTASACPWPPARATSRPCASSSPGSTTTPVCRRSRASWPHS
jgi:hypothetical protein